jgi:glycerophosphoryl diester phosphodiesterase
MVSALHEHGIRVVPWTANRVRDWQRLREVGCDGVITDFPAEAVAWREESAF